MQGLGCSLKSCLDGECKNFTEYENDDLPAPAMAAICATVSDVGCSWFAPVPFVSGGAETNSKHYIAYYALATVITNWVPCVGK